MAAGTVLTNNGEEWIAERIAGVQGAGTNNVAANAGTHVGCGTGTTTPVKANTALETEVGTRVTTTVTVVGTGAAAKYQAMATWVFDATRSLTEVALFSAITTGICFIHQVFASIGGDAGDSIAFTFTIDPS